MHGSRCFTILMVALCLASCANVGSTVRLDTDKAVITAEEGFRSVQQIALAGIQSGAITGARKAQIIALVDKGQAYEDAIVAGNDVAANVASLAGVISQLSALGVK